MRFYFPQRPGRGQRRRREPCQGMPGGTVSLPASVGPRGNAVSTGTKRPTALPSGVLF